MLQNIKLSIVGLVALFLNIPFVVGLMLGAIFSKDERDKIVFAFVSVFIILANFIK
jgi:hypothetical protein